MLALDGAMGVQFLMFGEEAAVVRVRDQRGRGRWRRVSGWMRGWVPSASPVTAGGGESDRGSEETVVNEDERPLLEREVSRDLGYGTRRIN